MLKHKEEVVTQQTNIIIPSQVACEKMVSDVLKKVLPKHGETIGRYHFSFNNLGQRELKLFHITIVQKLKLEKPLDRQQLLVLKNQLTLHLDLIQLRAGFLPLLTVNKVTYYSEKQKKSCTNLTLVIEITYKNRWFA